MAYQVVKTIKGRQYLYSQSTYREGGKVKTISHFIGAVDSQAGVLTTPDDDARVERPADTAQSLEEVLDKTELPPLEDFIKKWVPQAFIDAFAHREARLGEIPKKLVQPKSVPTKPIPEVSYNISPEYAVNVRGLKSEHLKHLKTLRQYGVDPSKFPPVTVKHGSHYGHHKPLLSDGLVITAPRRKLNREKLKNEYRKALHLKFIDTLEEEAPESIAPFKYAFDKSYQQTQDALTKYLCNTNSKEKFAKVLALKYWSIMHPVPAGKNKKIPPEKLGLIEYGNRKDWKADYASVMTALDKQGFKKLSATTWKEIKKSEKGIKIEAKKPTIFIFRRRKTIQRLQARVTANKALLQKLDLIQRYNLHHKII